MAVLNNLVLNMVDITQINLETIITVASVIGGVVSAYLNGEKTKALQIAVENKDKLKESLDMVIGFFDPESTVETLPTDVEVPTRTYTMPLETYTQLISGKSPEDIAYIQKTVNENQSAKSPVYSYTLTLPDSKLVYVIEYGLIKEFPVTYQTPTQDAPIEPSGSITPATSDIKSGQSVIFRVTRNPSSGDDFVKRIIMDFGDGESKTIDCAYGQEFDLIEHTYTYIMPEGSKYTGKTYFPSVTLIGSRGVSRTYEKVVSVTVSKV